MILLTNSREEKQTRLVGKTERAIRTASDGSKMRDSNYNFFCLSCQIISVG
jgi:hypothetical protein